MWDLSTLKKLNTQRVRTLRAARKVRSRRARLEALLEQHCSTRSLDSRADRRAVAKLLDEHLSA